VSSVGASNATIVVDGTAGSPTLRVGDLSNIYAGVDTLLVNVKNHGVKGDGTTDDTTAINAAIAANAGRRIFFPSGTYLVNPIANTGYLGLAVGLQMKQAGTRLVLDPGAVLQAKTNASDYSMIVEITAADCSIEGGTLIGDNATHTGVTGEWGHCIGISAGADRAKVVGTKVTKAWGDGILVWGAVKDVSIIDVNADDNRRQGMSIVDAVRPKVIGGVYQNTGLSKHTLPSAGIDFEPDPSSGRNVIDALCVGVLFYNNRGAAIQTVGATAQTTSVQISACRAVSNGTGTTSPGYFITGATNLTKMIGCTAIGSTGHGFDIESPSAEVTGCTADGNTLNGFYLASAANMRLIDPIARNNGASGIALDTTASKTSIIGGETLGNGQTATATYMNFDNFGTGTRVVGHVTDAGVSTNKPAYGFVNRTGATGATYFACVATGAFTFAPWLDQVGTAVTFPVPGATKQTLAAAATDAATTQTLANSLRSALVALGAGV
jgi:hypothetical protein